MSRAGLSRAGCGGFFLLSSSFLQSLCKAHENTHHKAIPLSKSVVHMQDSKAPIFFFFSFPFFFA